MIGNRSVARCALAAEVCPDDHRVQADVFLRTLEQSAEFCPRGVGHLVGRPDLHAFRLLIHHPGGRLEVRLVRQLGDVPALNDDVGVLEPLLDVAGLCEGIAAEVRHVRWHLREPEIAPGVLVEHGRSLLHRLLRVEDCGQLLVFDLNELGRRRCGLPVLRGNRCHFVSDEPDLVVAQQRHVLDVPARAIVRDVGRGDDREHPRHGERLRSVYGQYASVGVGAADVLRPDRSRRSDVGGIRCRAIDLVDSFYTGDRPPDDSERWRR